MEEKNIYWMAIVSFVLGIISFMFLLGYFGLIALCQGNPFIAFFLIGLYLIISLLSIIFGAISLVKIRTNSNLKGKGYVIIGWSLVLISFIILYMLITTGWGQNVPTVRVNPR